MLHSDTPNKTQMKTLPATRQPGCMSIHVPSRLSDHEPGQIRSKTPLSDAATRLRQSGMGSQQSTRSTTASRISSTMPASGWIRPLASPWAPGLWTEPGFGRRS